MENKCELLGKNVVDLLKKEKKRKSRNSANSHSVKTVKKNGICAKPATLEARCEQLGKNTIDLKKKRKRQNSATNHFANSAEPTASNFQKSKIKCEICDEELNLAFKINRHLTKFHDTVEKNNPKNDNEFLKTVQSEKSKEKEKVANLIQTKNLAASDSKPMLNVHREFGSNTKVSCTLLSKDRTYCNKNERDFAP